MSEIYVDEDGTRLKAGVGAYALYEKSPGVWKESASVPNVVLGTRAYPLLDTVLDLSQAEKVVFPAEDPRNEPGKVDLGHKYHRTIYGFDGNKVQVDVYRVLDAFQVVSPAIQHAIKKLLMPGTRGHKDRLKDLREAANSINQAILLEEQKENGKKSAHQISGN